MNVIGVLIDGVKVIIHWKTSRTVKWAFRNFIKDNLVMFIGDVLILLLLGGVWYRWENSSEKANTGFRQTKDIYKIFKMIIKNRK